MTCCKLVNNKIDVNRRASKSNIISITKTHVSN